MSDDTKRITKFFDLQKALTTDVKFIGKIERVLRALQLAEKEGNKEAWRQEALNLLRLCDYNPALFSSYYFPRFYRGKAMNFWSRPHAFSMLALGANLTLTIQASRQVGKCLSGETAIDVRHDDAGRTRSCTLRDLFEETKRKRDLSRTQCPESRGNDPSPCCNNHEH